MSKPPSVVFSAQFRHTLKALSASSGRRVYPPLTPTNLLFSKNISPYSCHLLIKSIITKSGLPLFWYHTTYSVEPSSVGFRRSQLIFPDLSFGRFNSETFLNPPRDNVSGLTPSMVISVQVSKPVFLTGAVGFDNSGLFFLVDPTSLIRLARDSHLPQNLRRKKIRPPKKSRSGTYCLRSHPEGSRSKFG